MPAHARRNESEGLSMALPDMIPVEDFFAPPVRTGATISPDGTRIAYLAPWKNRLNVWVEKIDSDEQARCVTADETRSVLNYEWTDDPRWLLYLRALAPAMSYARAQGPIVIVDDPGGTRGPAAQSPEFQRLAGRFRCGRESKRRAPVR
jgi:hypothetical protein